MSHQIDVSQNGGTTQNDWFSKIPKKNGWFRGTPPILGNLHMKSISSIISWFHTFWHRFSWGLRRYFFQELAAAGGDTVLFHCRDTENTKIVVLLGFMFVHVCYQGWMHFIFVHLHAISAILQVVKEKHQEFRCNWRIWHATSLRTQICISNIKNSGFRKKIVGTPKSSQILAF
jgi:hypothetical protein